MDIKAWNSGRNKVYAKLLKPGFRSYLCGLGTASCNGSTAYEAEIRLLQNKGRNQRNSFCSRGHVAVPVKYFPIGAAIILSISSCAADVRRQCDLPPLSDQKVFAIANAYLETQKMNQEFREIAEKRVRTVGCRYEYEEAEKLDSFGVGVIVVVDRNGKVVDFSGSN